jgi:hypothetical protein
MTFDEAGEDQRVAAMGSVNDDVVERLVNGLERPDLDVVDRDSADPGTYIPVGRLLTRGQSSEPAKVGGGQHSRHRLLDEAGQYVTLGSAVHRARGQDEDGWREPVAAKV